MPENIDGRRGLYETTFKRDCWSNKAKVNTHEIQKVMINIQMGKNDEKRSSSRTIKMNLQENSLIIRDENLREHGHTAFKFQNSK